MRMVAALAALAAFGFAGCASVSVTPLNAPPHAMQSRAEDTVEVYTYSTPDRPHVDVARLEAHDADNVKHRLRQQEADYFLPMLRARAAQLGCDALVLGPWQHRTGADGRTGICVAYTDLVEVVYDPAPPLDQSATGGAP